MSNRSIAWGYSGVWAGDFGVHKADDKLMAQLAFVADNGFESCTMPFGEVAEPGRRRDQIVDFVQQRNLRSVLRPPVAWITGEPDDVRRGLDRFLEKLPELKDALNVPIITAGAGQTHRFRRDFPIEAQLERLADLSRDFTAACHELGLPFGFENHGDYWCSDLVALCKAVPHMGIFLDTGNCFLAGEKPIPACREAAPYVIGTHWKDHHVAPDQKTLTFNIFGATLGQGDVGLRQIWHDILELHSDPLSIVMQWELVPPKGEDAWQSLRESWEFCRSLPTSRQEVANA